MQVVVVHDRLHPVGLPFVLREHLGQLRVRLVRRDIFAELHGLRREHELLLRRTARTPSARRRLRGFLCRNDREPGDDKSETGNALHHGRLLWSG